MHNEGIHSDLIIANYYCIYSEITSQKETSKQESKKSDTIYGLLCNLKKRGKIEKFKWGNQKKLPICAMQTSINSILKKNEWKKIQWRKCVCIFSSTKKKKRNKNKFQNPCCFKIFFFPFSNYWSSVCLVVCLFVCIFQYMSFTCQFIRLKLGRQHSNMHINCVFSIHPQLNFFLWTF